MSLELIKSRKVALLLSMLLFVNLTSGIGLARISGIDLDIQDIKFNHNVETNQTVNFEIFVKNKGTEATQSLSLTFDSGTGGGGFAAPIIIEPGETRVFTVGTNYRESGKFIVKAIVNTAGDVNSENNYKTATINVN